MKTANRNLMWHGMFLFLLGLLTGLLEQRFTNMRMGVAAHLEGVMNGTFLVALGAIWNEVRLAPPAKATAYWGALYATYANWLVTTLAAVFGTAACNSNRSCRSSWATLARKSCRGRIRECRDCDHPVLGAYSLGSSAQSVAEMNQRYSNGGRTRRNSVGSSRRLRGVLRQAFKFRCRAESCNQLLIQQPGGGALNAIFAAGYLALSDGDRRTAIRKRGMQRCEVNGLTDWRAGQSQLDPRGPRQAQSAPQKVPCGVEGKPLADVAGPTPQRPRPAAN